jgi:site-specific recombinase XerD
MPQEKIINDFRKYLIDKKYTKSSVYTYSFGLTNFLRFLKEHDCEPEVFNNTDIIKFKDSLNNSQQTNNVKLFAIKKYCDYLKAQKNITIDYEVDYAKPTSKKSSNLVDNFDKILQNIQEMAADGLLRSRNLLIFKFLYFLSLRVNDLIKIKKSNILDNHLCFGDRNIIINNELVKDLEKYFQETGLQNQEYLFFSCASRKPDFTKGLTVKSVEDIFNKYTGFLKNKISINDLRNSYNLIKNKSTTEINNVFGHSEITYKKGFLTYLSEYSDQQT